MIEILIVAVGTYAMRFLPMNLKLKIGEERLENMTTGVISALFVTSFVKPTFGLATALDTISLAVAAAVYMITRNMGAAILVATLFNAALRLNLHL